MMAAEIVRDLALPLLDTAASVSGANGLAMLEAIAAEALCRELYAEIETQPSCFNDQVMVGHFPPVHAECLLFTLSHTSSR